MAPTNLLQGRTSAVVRNKKTRLRLYGNKRLEFHSSVGMTGSIDRDPIRLSQWIVYIKYCILNRISL